MIDHEDADMMWMIALIGDNPVLFVLGLIAAGIVAFIACQNDDECSKRHCDRGHPVLMEHDCMCVETAK